MPTKNTELSGPWERSALPSPKVRIWHIDQTFSASTRRFGDTFGRLDDADLLRVNRAPALFPGIAS